MSKSPNSPLTDLEYELASQDAYCCGLTPWCRTCITRKNLRKRAARDIKCFYSKSTPHPDIWRKSGLRRPYSLPYQGDRSIPYRIHINVWRWTFDDVFDLHICAYAATSKTELLPYLTHNLEHVREYAKYRMEKTWTSKN